jgi:deazaflavin-dependent oxidoreductase (nitroreductase family)
MTDRTATASPAATAPWWVRMFTPLARPLLAAGVPLGFNGLVTVRGRKSGVPRTTPVAVIQYQGRRWIWAPWGEVHWVRNLRNAGRATITVRRQREEVAATELDRSERESFFRDVMGSLAGSMPGGKWFIRTVDGVDLDDPVEASEGRPVFELHRLG